MGWQMKVKCKCEYCGKSIIIEVPRDDYNNSDFDCTLGNSCNNCIPENSAARDGINESIYTEVKRNKKNYMSEIMAKYARGNNKSNVNKA